MATVPQDTRLEARHLSQEIAASRLYEAKIVLAKYLELAYICVSGHPELTKEVQLTARAARTQHLTTLGLMKRFTVTAKHIVGTIVPKIYHAVDLEDKDLVADCFAQIFDMAEHMKTEVIDTRQSSQNNLVLAEETKKKVTGRQEEIIITKEEENKLPEENRRAEGDIQNDLENTENEPMKMESHRDKWMRESEQLGDACSLVEASTSLGGVERQLSRIIQFWENMVATLKYLKDDTKAGEVYLKKLENPKYAERFKNSINRADQGWQAFGKICSDYVSSFENNPNASVSSPYDFLSVSTENIQHGQRGQCMKALVADIKDNTNIEEVA